MGLKLIYARSGFGKTQYCIQQIKKNIEENENKKLILLVPEQFTFQTETKLLKEIGEKSVLKAEVLSFKRMAYRVFNECGGITRERMKDAGKSMLIYKVLEDLSKEMKVFNRAMKQKGFIDIVSKTITEFKKYNIDITVLNEMIENIEDEESELRDKLEDLKKIYFDFNNKISNNYIDTDDELTFLSKKLEICNLYDDAEIWIDEFTTFTPQQLNVLTKLLKKAKRVNITLVSDGNNINTNFNNIFNVTAKTEKKLLQLLKDNRIPFDGILNLNKNDISRFKNSELYHLEKYFFAYPFKTFDKECENIKIYKSNNNYDEINFIAKDILRLVRDKRYRFKDISIVCRNIDSYEKITSAIFSEYNIPYFIDKKNDVIGNPLIILIMSVFEIYKRNWSYESVFKYIKTGLIDIEKEEIDLLENYVLENGIKGSKWKIDKWEYPISFLLKEEQKLEYEQKLVLLNQLKDKIVGPLEQFFIELKNSKILKEKCSLLYNFLLKLNIFTTMDILSKEFEAKGIVGKAKEYSQIQDIVIEVLEQLVDVLSNEEINNKEFIKILQVGFEKYEIGVIQLSLDQVNIGDIARIRSREVKALYILGVNDGVLPSANKDEGILSDRDREILNTKGMELASDTKTKAFEEQFLVYTALTIPTNYLVLTYPLADFEGKALRPSIIISRIKKIYSNLEEESDIFKKVKDKYEKIISPIPTFNNLIEALRREYDGNEIENYWGSVYNWYKEYPDWKEKCERVFNGLIYNNQPNNIDKNKIKNLYKGKESSKLMFSVSRMEKYSQCPFAYYVQYGLRAKERKLYDFTAPDLGSFMHGILDKFTNEIKNKNIKWKDLSKQECKELISTIVDGEVNGDSNMILNSSKKYKYFTERFKSTLTKSVTIISEHMKRSECEIFKNEFNFGTFKDCNPIKIKTLDGEEIFFTGRIDRIDTLNLEDGNTYIRIIDYKTGKKKFNLNELYYGLQIQLLVYLDAILKNSDQIIEKQSLPGAILYFRIDDPIIKKDIDLDDEEIEKEVLKKLKMDGLIIKDPKVVKAMDNSFEKTSLIIPAGFNKDSSFSKNSNVITKEDFDLLRKYVNKKVAELCSEMLNGNIKIEPAKEKDFSCCSYCNYSAICQFDTTFENNKYKVIPNAQIEDIWNNISNYLEDKNEN